MNAMRKNGVGRACSLYITRSCYILLLLLFLLVTMKGALALTEITAPTSIAEGELLEISFSTDEPASYRILKEGVEVSTTNTYSELLRYDAAGLYRYTFEATGTETISEERTVEVLDTPLVISLVEPSVSDYATSLIPVELFTNIPADLCYTVVEEQTHTLTAINNTHFNGTLSLDDGLHTIDFKCNRNGELTEEQRTIRVDTVAPSMTLGPSGTLYDAAILSTSTDEIATCRYATEQLSFEQMTNAFPQTGLDHTLPLAIGEGSHTYYVSCQDVYGNTADTKSTSFTLAYRPTASIEVEGSNPRPAGQYEVTLTVSEPLGALPTLTLNYQGGSSNDLVLTKEEDSIYKGYVIIESDAGEGVASWTFEGVDLDGLTGSEITEGSLFLFDTVTPEKVDSFRAENATGAVKLTWYDEESTVNIYKSTTYGVDYTHYYKTVSGNEYYDNDVGGVVRYYYRIAAVDDAGNIGPLSDEEWASASQEPEAAIALDGALQFQLERQMERVDIYILDAEQTVADLEGEVDAERAWVVSAMELLPDAKKAVQQLKSIRSSLADLRGMSLSKAEFDQRLTRMKKEIESALSLLPYDITVTNGVEYEETTSESSLDRAISYLLTSHSDAYKESFKLQAYEVDAASRIRVKAAHIIITTADGATKKMTLVEKRLLSDGVQDVIALELLPTAGEVRFLTAAPILLEEGVHQFSFGSLTDEKIRYVYDAIVEMPRIRESSLLLLPKPSSEAVPVEQAEAITGNAAFTLPGGVSNSEGMMILFGVIIIVGLLFYYFRIDNEGMVQALPSSHALQPNHLQQSHHLQQSQYQQWQPVQSPTPGQSVKTLLVTRQEDSLTSLLVKGHSLIDENRYFDALHFYKKALEAYVAATFSSEQLRQAIYGELELLHAKLNLYNSSSKAHDMIYVDDVEGLSSFMHQMREYAIRVGEEETRLVMKAKQEYLFFYEQLQQMKAARHDIE
jgi:hypothetical protein